MTNRQAAQHTARAVYFPGLNGVRFIAAAMVIVDHTELFKFYLGYDTLWSDRYSFHLGAFGVTLFFVLSGFLITYLLLSEHRATGSVAIKQFYLRRILRIWPLYYLLFFLGYLVIPRLEAFDVRFYSTPVEYDVVTLGLYACLLANVGFVFRPIPYAGVLWSVAVEEQFYLIWPHLLRFARRLPLILGGLIALYVLAKAVIPDMASTLGRTEEELSTLVTRTRFSCMMIGALGAYYVFGGDSRLVRLAYHPVSQLVAVAAFLVLLLDAVTLPAFLLIKDEAIAAVSCILIVNIATNPHTLVHLEYRALNYLGRVSYGLYIYHLFAVVITIKSLVPFLRLPDPNGLVGYPIAIGLVIGLTTLIAHLSYMLLERPILALKERHAVVVSGEAAKEMRRA
jgi:peptidoglycan/LPS O-acetylase OafA/YrhL